MKLGIDFKAVATKAAGHGVGAVVAGKLNSVSFINKIANPTTQGLVKAAIGYVGIPLLAKKMGMTGKGKGNLIEAVGEGVGMIGILQAGHNVQPALFPAVAGISGYEENPIQGLGELYDTDRNVSGYEESPVSGYDESPVSGYDDEVSGYDED